MVKQALVKFSPLMPIPWLAWMCCRNPLVQMRLCLTGSSQLGILYKYI